MADDTAAGSGRRSRRVRRVGYALILDNLGSGLFLPLTVVFVVRVIGLSVGTAGALLGAGSLIGLLAPALVARVGDRVGANLVVVAGMVLQAAGVGSYLLADGAAGTVVAAALTAAGVQTFYSGLFALVAEAIGDGPKDRPFVVMSMARAAAFGAGALLGALALSLFGTNGLRIAAAIDGASFLIAAVVLLSGSASVAHTCSPVGPTTRHRARSVLRDGPFLVLIAATGLLGLSIDVLLVGLPVFALTVLRTPPWVPGVCLALVTLSSATLGGRMFDWTAHLRRTTAMAVAGALSAVWAAASALTVLVPTPARPAWLIGSTLVLIVGLLAAGPRANALAEAAAPPESRARYLAAFQYAFTLAVLAAPLAVGLFGVAEWLPWLVVGCASVAGVAMLPWLARSLPEAAVSAVDRRRLPA